MARLVVAVGYVTENKDGSITLLAMNGAQFLLPAGQKAVIQKHPVDTSTDGAQRIFLGADTDVYVQMTAAEAFRPRGPRHLGSTIAKYLDDGGTISKSRDDGGKDPLEDKEPIEDKDPSEDKSPLDDEPRARGRR
jgi:hypothetical protein